MVEVSPTGPIDTSAEPAKLVIGGSADWYGASSLERFNSASGLTYTHEDAQGFLDYPTSFSGNSANFWFKDAGVKVWQYEEAYDNWQDTYGIDSVTAFYHSGHGGMDGNGVFQIPLGGVWDSRDWGFSNRMSFSDEELRYLFWSTCYSIRVSGPDNPIRTWWNANRGNLRMMFGYETTSVDNPSYGRYFWDEWKKGKSFTRAFLDASWRISHNQVAVSMAYGANQADAVNRLNNERYIYKNAVAKGWCQWQWIGTLPQRAFSDSMKIPKEMNSILLGKDLFSDERIIKIAEEIGFTKTQSQTILFDDIGNRMIAGKNKSLNVNCNGALEISFSKANTENSKTIDEHKAISIAKKTIKDLEFDKEIELAIGNTRNVFTCGGTDKGSGTLDKPSVVETIVEFRQSHNGIKSINSDHGLIRIGIDNDGNVTNIYNSTRKVLGETKKARAIIEDPKSSGKLSKYIPETFEAKINSIKLAATPILKAGQTLNLGTDETLHEYIGYDFSENLGVIVHQKDVEITFPSEFKKRYKLRVPLMG